MVELMDQLGLADLVTSLDGLSVVGAVVILAETGDLGRFDHPRTWVKHAGLAPRANESGNFWRGRRGPRVGTGQGCARLWRAIWALLPNNAVFGARYTQLRTRANNPLTDEQARAELGAALLRQLFLVVTRRVGWDAAIGGQEVMPLAA
jgi:transposase